MNDRERLKKENKKEGNKIAFFVAEVILFGVLYGLLHNCLGIAAIFGVIAVGGQWIKFANADTKDEKEIMNSISIGAVVMGVIALIGFLIFK